MFHPFCLKRKTPLKILLHVSKTYIHSVSITNKDHKPTNTVHTNYNTETYFHNRYWMCKVIPNINLIICSVPVCKHKPVRIWTISCYDQLELTQTSYRNTITASSKLQQFPLWLKRHLMNNVPEVPDDRAVWCVTTIILCCFLQLIEVKVLNRKRDRCYNDWTLIHLLSVSSFTVEQVWSILQ